MISLSSSAMTSMRLRLMPREKQYLAKKAELVSTVWDEELVCSYEYTDSLVGGLSIFSLTFPPRTSSPMIKHAAVLIVLLLRS